MTNRFIQKLRGFAEFTRDEVKALEDATRSATSFGLRKDLIREGDQPGSVFVILEGWAFRYKVLPNGSRQVMAFLMPGDACDLYIGLLAEMDHGIQTTTEAQVARISRQDMDALMDTYPGMLSQWSNSQKPSAASCSCPPLDGRALLRMSGACKSLRSAMPRRVSGGGDPLRKLIHNGERLPTIPTGLHVVAFTPQMLNKANHTIPLGQQHLLEAIMD